MLSDVAAKPRVPLDTHGHLIERCNVEAARNVQNSHRLEHSKLFGTVAVHVPEAERSSHHIEQATIGPLLSTPRSLDGWTGSKM